MLLRRVLPLSGEVDRLRRIAEAAQPKGAVAHPSRALPVLSPVGWVVGDTRGVEEGVAARIASRIIEDIASELARALTTRRWEEGYMLHTIELETGSVYYVIGNKVARNSVLSWALNADRTARGAFEKLSA